MICQYIFDKKNFFLSLKHSTMKHSCCAGFATAGWLCPMILDLDWNKNLIIYMDCNASRIAREN